MYLRVQCIVVELIEDIHVAIFRLNDIGLTLVRRVGLGLSPKVSIGFLSMNATRTWTLLHRIGLRNSIVHKHGAHANDEKHPNISQVES